MPPASEQSPSQISTSDSIGSTLTITKPLKPPPKPPPPPLPPRNQSSINNNSSTASLHTSSASSFGKCLSQTSQPDVVSASNFSYNNHMDVFDSSNCDILQCQRHDNLSQSSCPPKMMPYHHQSICPRQGYRINQDNNIGNCMIRLGEQKWNDCNNIQKFNGYIGREISLSDSGRVGMCMQSCFNNNCLKDHDFITSRSCHSSTYDSCNQYCSLSDNGIDQTKVRSTSTVYTAGARCSCRLRIEQGNLDCQFDCKASVINETESTSSIINSQSQETNSYPNNLDTIHGLIPRPCPSHFSTNSSDMHKSLNDRCLSQNHQLVSDSRFRHSCHIEAIHSCVLQQKHNLETNHCHQSNNSNNNLHSSYPIDRFPSENSFSIPILSPETRNSLINHSSNNSVVINHTQNLSDSSTTTHASANIIKQPLQSQPVDFGKGMRTINQFQRCHHIGARALNSDIDHLNLHNNTDRKSCPGIGINNSSQLPSRHAHPIIEPKTTDNQPQISNLEFATKISFPNSTQITNHRTLSSSQITRVTSQAGVRSPLPDSLDVPPPLPPFPATRIQPTDSLSLHKYNNYPKTQFDSLQDQLSKIALDNIGNSTCSSNIPKRPLPPVLFESLIDDTSSNIQNKNIGSNLDKNSSQDLKNETNSYGLCPTCKSNVLPKQEACKALDQVYHADCFTCCECKKTLRGKTFYKVYDKVYCEEDYKYSNSTELTERCASCQQPIVDMVIQAIGLSYHPSCFKCSVCEVCLDGVEFTIDMKNRIYCIEDFHQIYSPRCNACSLPITPRDGSSETVIVVSMGKDYHVDCFRCHDCGLLLSDKKSYKSSPLENYFLCERCYLKNSTQNQVVYLDDGSKTKARSHDNLAGRQQD